MLTDGDRKLIDDLYAIQALKFGEFRLKIFKKTHL